MAALPIEMGQNHQLSHQISGSGKKVSVENKQTNTYSHKLRFNKEIGSIKRRYTLIQFK